MKQKEKKTVQFHSDSPLKSLNFTAKGVDYKIISIEGDIVEFRKVKYDKTYGQIYKINYNELIKKLQNEQN